MTPIEQKLIRLLASKIKKEDIYLKKYEFETKDLIKLLNTSKGRFYRDIDKITDSLMQKIIKMKNIETKEFKKYHWIETCHYKNGVLTMEIHHKMKEFYLELNEYTKYQLKNILQFKNAYSFRIYELLKQYEGIGQRIVKIDDLRISLDISEKKYIKYANLKQKVLNISMDEINNKTDIYFEFEEIKTSRKVTAIKFYIYSNKKNDEIATTLEPMQGQLDFATQELINEVKQIIKEPLSDEELHKLLKTAKNDVNKIQVAYKIAEQNTKPIENLYTFLQSAIKNNYKLPVGKENVKKSKFANFQEREDWDFTEIEKRGREQMLKDLEGRN